MPKLLAQYFLNHYLDLAEVEWQVEELAKAGYEGIYPTLGRGWPHLTCLRLGGRPWPDPGGVPQARHGVLDLGRDATTQRSCRRQGWFGTIRG